MEKWYLPEQSTDGLSYLLLAPTPLVLSSIKLLNHEVVNTSLICWVLQNKPVNHIQSSWARERESKFKRSPIILLPSATNLRKCQIGLTYFIISKTPINSMKTNLSDEGWSDDCVHIANSLWTHTRSVKTSATQLALRGKSNQYPHQTLTFATPFPR